jgi:hypothetical protein
MEVVDLIDDQSTRESQNILEKLADRFIDRIVCMSEDYVVVVVVAVRKLECWARGKPVTQETKGVLKKVCNGYLARVDPRSVHTKSRNTGE